VEALPSARVFPFPEWQRAFESAMRESDSTTFLTRLQAAKHAIYCRLREKFERPLGPLERIALNDAIHLLRVLRSEGATQYWLGQEN
jgi:hypothetical protein